MFAIKMNASCQEGETALCALLAFTMRDESMNLMEFPYVTYLANANYFSSWKVHITRGFCFVVEPTGYCRALVVVLPSC